MNDKDEVARIEDVAIFRDAHPEAVYLAHDLTRYRVVDYEGEWKVARWEHPDSPKVLGKWLRCIKAVQVEREPKHVTTRGSWDECFKQYEIKRFSDANGCPKKGCLEFGVWDYERKWQGYTEIDLATNQKRKVALAEVTQRFSIALERGDRFPFLHNLSYRTQGWQWDFGAVTLQRLDADWLRSLGDLVGGILEHFLAEAVESRVADMGVRLDLPGHELQVLDSTPGGNGLSETLLAEGRLGTALENCLRTLAKFKGKSAAERFEKYVLALCHDKPGHSFEEVKHVVRELHVRWAG
jgi:hypothetical protein